MKFLQNNEIILKQNLFRIETSRIWINGHRTWHTISGTVLEKAIQINTDYLLFVSNKEQENDWIDICSIFLINKSGRVLEHRSINAVPSKNNIATIYQADYLYWEEYESKYCGSLDNFNLIPPNKVTFQFRDNIFSIEILDQPYYPRQSTNVLENNQKSQNLCGLINKHDLKFWSRLKFDLLNGK